MLICILGDMTLVPIGVFLMGHISGLGSGIETILKLGGALFLLWFAWTCWKASLNPTAFPLVAPQAAQRQMATVGSTPPAAAPHADSAVVPSRTRIPAPILTALGCTFLNPSAYLDCVVLIGSLSNHFGDTGRWAFAGGAMISSLIWFPAITYGARLLAKPLSKPRVNQWTDRIIALVMVAMATRIIFL